METIAGEAGKLTSPGLEISRGISELGVLVIATGFFIIIAITQIYLNNKRFDKMFEKYMSGADYAGVMTKMKDLVDTVNDLLIPVKGMLDATDNSAKEECTYPQINRVLKLELRVTKLTLIDAARAIITKNNIHSEENNTEQKVKKVVFNTIATFKQGISIFKFKGIRFGVYVDSSVNDSLSECLYRFIMSDNRNYAKLENDLDLIFDELLNNLRDKLGES